MRAALRPLAGLAERTGCAIILVRHLTKRGNGRAITTGGGSIGIAGAARSVLRVLHRDPEDSDRRVLASAKCNLAPPPQSLGFRVRSTEAGASRIEWDGHSPHTAETLTEARAGEQSEAGQRSKTDECAECLAAWLAPAGMERKEVLRLGMQAGFGERTIDLAARSASGSFTSPPDSEQGSGHFGLCLSTPPVTPPIPASPPDVAGIGGNGGLGRNDEELQRGPGNAIEREAIMWESQLPSVAGR